MGCGGSKKKYDTKDISSSQSETKDFNRTMEFLSKVPLFKRLPKDQHPFLAEACEFAAFKADQVIIKQGAEGNEFFVIQTGQAQVTVVQDNRQVEKVTVLGTGDYFGETALLRETPRTATITALSDMTTLKVTRAKFRELGLNDKLVFANRKAVGGGGVQMLETKPPTPKSDADKEKIKEALRKNENLTNMVVLDDRRLEQIADVAWKEEVPKGKEIIKEGDFSADYFYIVQSGSFEILVEDEGGTKSAEKAVDGCNSKKVNEASEGDSFGELALLYLVPRAATVMAKENSVVWVVDRSSFKNILLQASSDKIKEYETMLHRVDILAPLLTQERHALASALVEMHFVKDEVILQQGDLGHTFYILYDGDVTIIKDGKEEGTQSASVRRKDPKFFGEKALLDDEPRAATVQVTSPTAKALAIDRPAFDALLGPLSEMLRAAASGEDRTMKTGGGPAGNLQNSRRERIWRKDLNKIGLLGSGAFGAVELVEHKTTQETYAMKCLSKGFIVKSGMQDSVKNEKNILLMTNSKFIVKLHETYNGDKMLFFLLELASGGELYATYNRKGLHGRDDCARFYCAGVILGFEHLHERHIIYRDLKPENLLLTEAGFLKITDMGLAKFVIGKTYTCCGTPDYFAPEVIDMAGHTSAVDWWTVGILVYEMMAGQPPFTAPTQPATYAKVKKGINKVAMPTKCQGVVGDFIKGLLKKEPSERLACRPGGTKNLKTHKWFENFDWNKYEQGKLDPPYKPVVKSKKDLGNFNASRDQMPPVLDYKDDGSGWDNDFATAA